MKINYNLFIYLLIVFISVSCKVDNEKLIIAAASNTQFALNEIATSFSKKSNIKVDIVLGSSGMLTTQIINGAPYDIFFAANMMYPNVLFEKGKTINKPEVYANGIPVIWYVKDGELTEEIFLKDNIEKIVIADPKNAPYGEAAVAYFNNNGIYNSIESKLVYGESISQVNEHILNKTADIGVSAKSIVMSPKLKGTGSFIELTKEYWIKQGVVIIKNETDNKLKSDFLKFVSSPEGIKILESYGYSI